MRRELTAKFVERPDLAIAVAKRQATRSFELRAALSLAKLYCSMGRNADAHSVLGSALVGFAPTPDFPEVEEAVAFLATVPASARTWSEQASTDFEWPLSQLRRPPS